MQKKEEIGQRKTCMVIYEKYQPFRSWLRKVKDKDLIQAMANNQAKKPRSGNTFAIVGANTYIGWSLICQLVYKFQECSIIAIDNDFSQKRSITKNYDFETRVNKLKEYFKFDLNTVFGEINDIGEKIIRLYNPDFIIDCNFGNIIENLESLNYKNHLIMLSNFNSKTSIGNFSFKVTEFKTPSILGTCNLVTLIDSVFSPQNDPNTILNRLLLDVINKGVIAEKDRNIIAISLEDITRAPVKILRRGQKQHYVCYNAYDKAISIRKIADIMSNTFREFGVNLKIDIPNNFNTKKVKKEKRTFIQLIDKHRPPVEYVISYSCKNYLETK